ncbi:MAG: [FeFe] hydrogenase H-cluster radical SAM maturase HydG [Desulfovibrio sp.]|nr:[FeFe] hydrogenase H-cluster radical SAM maturase HydG [Desulfovibrio sp.]
MPRHHDSPPAWLNSEAITTALGRQSEPDQQVLKDILDKSLALEPLGLDEIAALLRVRAPQKIVELEAAADLVKQKVYGDRIVLTAPLHLDSHCESDCRYCAYRSGSDQIERKRLDPHEIREAGKKLIRQGHKRVILTCGHSEQTTAAYLAEACDILSHLSEGQGEIRRINLDAGEIEPQEYAILRQADAGAINIYQETYSEEYYKKAHPKGPKSNFARRLHAPEIALESGMDDVALGIAFGLGPWEFDLLALSLHAAHLASACGTGSRVLNLHRVRPAAGCSWKAPLPMNDPDFIRAVAITRLAIPYAGIMLATQEASNLWKEGCNTGASQVLTGSLANPYENWLDAPGEKIPFPTGQETHLDEVVRILLEEGRHLPSFCTACPRLGRSGHEFIAMAEQGDIKSQCGPNSLASFLEFLLNYATPGTREMGEALIRDRLGTMSAHERGAAEKLLQKVRAGRSDEFI